MAEHQLPPTPAEGLSTQEAQRRKDLGLINKSSDDGGKTVGQIVRENLFTLFNLLNVSLAIAVALVGRFKNMLFMGVVISNTVIGTWQELRARATVRKLQVLNAPVCHVLRDGKEVSCAAEDVVQGDLLVVRAGDQVMADGPVISGTGFADESLLTGESDAVEKKADAQLMSGSFITEGNLTFRADHVGDERYAAALTREGREIKRPQSMLMKDLNKLIRFVSIVLVPLGILLLLTELFAKHSTMPDAVTHAVAAMVGMIPEGLILLTSVALYVGVAKLGRHNTLAQEMVGIETLARADVLCLDKTGTLTTGGMTLHQIIPVDVPLETVENNIGRFLAAFSDTSGTLNALRQLYQPVPANVTATIPFSSARKYSAASFSNGDTLLLGAPEFMPKGLLSEQVMNTVNENANLGLRVIVICSGKGQIQDKELPVITDVCGLIVLQDTLRDSAEKTLAYFRKQDVDVRIISGDNPRTVSAVAHRAGVEGWDRWVDTATLDTEEKLLQAVDNYTVFGRVTPKQKRLLVEALKRKGHSVAMTGDGVNDIPALKAADCSIAMASGADATRHAAQIILLDNDFASLPKVVAEGRRVVGNISRAASMFLVKTLYSFALALFTLFMPGTYPFQPIQLTMISSITIGIPSFFLALLPNLERIRGKFLRRVLQNAIPGALAVTLCSLAAMTLPLKGIPEDVCSSMAALIAGLVGILVLAGVCVPFTKIKAAILGSMCIGLIGAVLVLGQKFIIDVFAFTPQHWLIFGTMTAAAVAIMMLASLGMRKINKA